MSKPILVIVPDRVPETKVDLSFLLDFDPVSDWQTWNMHWELSTKIKAVLDTAHYQFSILHTSTLSEVTEQLAKRSHDDAIGGLWQRYGSTLLHELRANQGFAKNERFWCFLLEGLLGQYCNLGYMLQRGMAQAKYYACLDHYTDCFPEEESEDSVGGLVITWHHPQMGYGYNRDTLHELTLREPRQDHDDSFE